MPKAPTTPTPKQATFRAGMRSPDYPNVVLLTVVCQDHAAAAVEHGMKLRTSDGLGPCRACLRGS